MKQAHVRPRGAPGAMLLLAAAAAIAAAFFPRPALAQAPDTVYVGTHHSPWAAGLLEGFVFASAGYAYAGDWSRGIPITVFRVAAGIGYIRERDEPGPCEGSCEVWRWSLVATSVWAVVGAVRTARDHNARVRRLEEMLNVAPAPGGGLDVGVRLRVR